MASVDVTVRGGGIFGLSIAWACAQRGAKVRLIEDRAIGAGASGGLVGALAPHAPGGDWTALKAFQLQSLLMAEGWWAGVSVAGGVDPGYLRSGRLMPLADAQALEQAHDRVAAAAVQWRGQAEWHVVPSTGAAWEPASPAGHLVRENLSARLSPRHAAAAILAALAASGTDVVIGEAPDSGAVVHATGLPGLQDLSAAFGIDLGRGVKGQAALLKHDAATLPQIYAGGLHVVPHADGTVAIGSTSETTWAQDGPDDQAEALIARARALMPVLAEAPVLERWAGIRPRARSRGPVLGQWPGRPGHFVANGGFKIGFGLAPRVAQVMAGLLLEGSDDIPAEFHLETLLAG